MLLDINELTFSYGRGAPVINKVSSSLAPGCIAGLLGANGVGKSTLLKLAAGLLYNHLGEIQTLGLNPQQRKAEMLENLFLVPEQTWLPNMRSDTYLKLYAPLYPNFDEDLFLQCVQRFELTHPNNLLSFSFGQQKKFLIAFGIATKAQLFLMDEPTNGLDIPAKEQFRQILLETISETQSAIISTHQARDLEGVIDTIMLMDNQQLITDSLENISQAFSVEKFDTKPDNALYALQNFNQWLCLVPYLETAQREIDLELLFNAFHQNKNAFLREHSAQKTITKGAQI